MGDCTRSEFVIKLQELINSYNVENGSNTPDFILADYLAMCLDVFSKTVIARDRWYLPKGDE